MITIKQVNALEILDSRGNPTVEATIKLSDGNTGTASVPSGASMSTYEAIELRDTDPTRYQGMGVLKAVKNINTVIGPKIIGMDVVKQGKIDQAMIGLDGTQNKSILGSNAILAVSLAVCKAAAMALKMPLYAYIAELIQNKLPEKIEHLPTPTFNVINGGKHGTGNLDFQEFHVVPATVKPYHEALRMGEEVYHQIKEILVQRNASYAVGDEGGFTPNLFTNLDALEIIMEAIRATPYKFGMEIFLGLDIAATHIRKENNYVIKDRTTPLTTEEFIEFLSELHREYRILLLEDPITENDWQGWKMITAKLGNEINIIGDDLLATNPVRLEKAITEKACTAILVKPNQIGTLSETLAVIKRANKADFKVIVSNRSGETNDSFIADLAVGVRAHYIKFGAPARGERIAKYNRLLHIEKELKLI